MDRQWRWAMALVILVGWPLFGKRAKEIELLAWPNPFRADTEVLTIAQKDKTDFPAKAKVTIYNFAGKKVFSGTFRGRVRWSGFDRNGNKLSAGVYFVRLLLFFDDGSVNTQWVTVAIRS